MNPSYPKEIPTMVTQDTNKHDDAVTTMLKVVLPILLPDEIDLSSSDAGVGDTGASVGCHEMVGAGVFIKEEEEEEGAIVFGQQIDSALRAKSQSSDVLSNWTAISLATPQVVSSENGSMADSSILVSLQNSHFDAATGGGTGDGDGGDTGTGTIDGRVYIGIDMDSSTPKAYEKLSNAVVESKSQFMLSDWLSSTASGGGGVTMNVGRSDPRVAAAGAL